MTCSDVSLQVLFQPRSIETVWPRTRILLMILVNHFMFEQIIRSLETFVTLGMIADIVQIILVNHFVSSHVLFVECLELATWPIALELFVLVMNSINVLIQTTDKAEATVTVSEVAFERTLLVIRFCRWTPIGML